jgi:hypothetical protein
VSFYASYEDMPEGERAAALEEVWEDAHPHCEECHKRGCPHGCCDMEGLVMLTDGLIFHPLCLAKAQAVDARMGGTR